MMDVRNISSKMAGMNIDVSQARGDDRSPEEVLSTVDNKPFGMNLHVYVPPTIDDMPYGTDAPTIYSLVPRPLRSHM